MELSEDDVLHILKLIDESKFDYFQLEVGELKITVSKGEPIPIAGTTPQPVALNAAPSTAPAAAKPAVAPAPPSSAPAAKAAATVPEGMLAITAPLGPVRFLSGTEALTGFVMITWSASFTYLEMERFWRR